jgi:ketosteroid isomerase-like protein
MSQENVALAKRVIAAFNAADIGRFTALTTPDFEWYPSLAPVEGRALMGADGIRSYFASLNTAWEQFEIVPDSFRDLPDTVVMLGRLEGRGKGSGVPVDSSLAMVFRIRDGAISCIRGYLDHDEALQAVGLEG